MTKSYLIGVDLGTSVVKTTLFDLQGNTLASATRETNLQQPAPGLAEQEGDDYYAATLDTLREVTEKAGIGPGTVAAITFDGQMAGAIGIDRDWNAITPWYPSALDTRYLPYVDQMVAIAGDQLVESNGALPFMAPRMLWWKNEHPDLYRRLHKILILSNYVAGRLADLPADEAFIDPSYLTWTGLSDTANRRWSRDLCQMFDLSMDKLPQIVPATTVIGGLSKQAAQTCGLAEGTPLVAGAGDQVAGFLGAGMVEAGQLINVAGTFPVLATYQDHFLADTRYGMLQPLAGPISDSHWNPMMYISGGGLTHRWFRDEFAGLEIKQAEDEGLSPYQLLDKQASDVPPGSEGLLFIPHLVGRSCPNEPAVRGMWAGFTWTHKKRHFYRALLESIAYDHAVAMAVLQEYNPDVNFSEVRVIGGGAGSELWNQIKADVMGLPYVRLQRENVAALGCAIMGGYAVGIYSNMADTASRLAQTIARIEPQPAHHAHYQAYVTAYRQAFEQTRQLYTTLQLLREMPAPDNKSV